MGTIPISQPNPWLQPSSFDDFQCIGAACEDTCCGGMAVAVDEATYTRYQACDEPALTPKMRQYVTIEPAPTATQYARIQPTDGHCPFLTEQLCGIQATLGEGYLSTVCATYPRLLHAGPEMNERSLNLSCPEAARLVLTRRDPMTLTVAPPQAMRATPQLRAVHPYEDEIRSALLDIFQDRRYRVPHRVALAGHLCAKLSEIFAGTDSTPIPEMLVGFRLAIDGEFFNVYLAATSAIAETQLGLVLELLIGRVKLDYAAPRFLNLYEEFAAGLGLTTGSTLGKLADLYAQAQRCWFMSFAEAQSHLFENYLVSYALKTLFPFGSGPINRALGMTQPAEIINAQFLLLAVHFGIIQGLHTGLAAKYNSEFSIEAALRIIQTSVRTFEHCLSFPRFALDLLAAKGISHPAGSVALTQWVKACAGTTARH